MHRVVGVDIQIGSHRAAVRSLALEEIEDIGEHYASIQPAAVIDDDPLVAERHE